MAAAPTVVIANRGEVAVRIIRTARDRGLRTVALFAEDDRAGMPVRLADGSIQLPGRGPAAYLDVASVVAAARTVGAGALVHPGWGFLSENARFAAECATAGLVFVGPSPAALDLFGDKSAARARAEELGVPVLPATAPGSSLDDIAHLLAEHPAGVMIKAAAGGGGRGMRAVTDAAALPAAYERCRSEARAGFGDDAVYAEVLLRGSRHVEVQVVGDGERAVALGDRDCSIQRRHQKLIEIAPAPGLTGAQRERLHDWAARLIGSAGYAGLATVEFLLDAQGRESFLEVNPRLQVEHTVTEQVSGLDLVAIQFGIAEGRTVDELVARGDLVLPVPVAGVAVEARVNAEVIAASGEVLPSVGLLGQFAAPTGPGIRVDTAAQPGLRQGPSFDSLLVKVIAQGSTLTAALRRCDDALGELVTHGVETNAHLLRAVLQDPSVRDWNGDTPVTTDWFEANLERLTETAVAEAATVTGTEVAQETATEPGDQLRLDEGELALRAPTTGVVVSVTRPGSLVPEGGEIAVLEAMKMEHVVRAEQSLQVRRVLVQVGDLVEAHAPVLTYADAAPLDSAATAEAVDLDRVRDDLAEVRERHHIGSDEARAEATGKRHRAGRHTARENIADLVDEGSFVEFGALAIAAQRGRRSDADLIANTPADGLVAGVATVNGGRFGSERGRAVVMSYDYSVLAGTQGMRNHAKTDRMLELAHREQLPVVFFTEGGGGRPGDTDHPGVSGLDVPTFRTMGSLSGRVPLVGITGGRCFAGNAALLGMCDVVIATPDATIGMGGPAMIEGGGLGVYPPDEIGPIEVQRRNGVVHLVARDDADAVALARTYLSYFQGQVDEWEAPDARLARHVVPENRLRTYDVRAAIEAVVDVGSVLELRRDWAGGIVTALVRVEGRPFGLVANDNRHLGGAIDAPGADKLSAFLRLCNAHGLPIVSFCDTPGFMVGPEAEKQATVTRFSRLFIDGAALTVPFGTVILRKGYGLGAQAMAGGSFIAPRFVVAWPTGEIGGMGLEGAVRLGYRKELEAIDDPAERQAEFDRLVARHYAEGKALTAAAVLEIDDVIDPADTRRWISTLA